MFMLLIGAAIRFHALAWDARFHPDEALFATFARKAAVNGDWLLGGALDKTPLSIYADALSMMLVGVRPLPNGVLTLDVHAGEFAARVPGTLASILLIAVMYAAGKALYPHSPGKKSLLPLLTLFLTALSPYAIAFSPTVFTDGLMLLCVTTALWMGARGRWWWAGFWLAAGFGCKQQALFYLPLVVAVGWLIHRNTSRRLSLRTTLLFIVPIALCLILLVAWDNARAEITGFWALAAENNAPDGVVQPDELLPRLLAWAEYIGHIAGAGWLTAGLVVLAGAAAVIRFNQLTHDRRIQIDLLLLAYTLAYFGFHWLIAFPTHDRYPLLILPPLLLLIARGLDWAWEGIRRFRETYLGRSKTLSYILYAALLCLAALCFLPSAFDASERRLHIGGDRGQQAEIDRLGAYLDAKPLGTIVYDHWLGWELGYYLGTWSDKRLTYYPNPVALADDARAQPDPAPRYFVAPLDAPSDAWLDALRRVGFNVALDFKTVRQVVYRLTRGDA